MKSILINEDVLDKLLTKALPEDYEVLLNESNLSDDEYEYYLALINLLKEYIKKCNDWIHLPEVKEIINKLNELDTYFFDDIENEFNSFFKSHFEEISLFLFLLYSKYGKVAYSTINKPYENSINDESAFKILINHNYNLCRNLTMDLSENLRKIIWKGVTDGLSVDEISEKLLNSLDEKLRSTKFTAKTRAKMIAVTEANRIQNTARLQCFIDNNIEKVTIIPIGDGKECKYCLDLIDKCPFYIQDAQDLLPLHPNCRHYWSPVLEDNLMNIEPFIVDLTNY